MSAPTSRTPRQDEGSRASRRIGRRLLLAGIAALLVVAGCVYLLVGGLSSGGTGTNAAATPFAGTTAPTEAPVPADPGTAVTLPTAAPTSVPSVVMADVPGAPEKLTPVPLAGTGDYGNGVTVALADMRSVTAHGYGVGEISGPALAVTVRITNSSSAPVSLADTAVNLYRGAQGVRAARLSDGATAPFSGSLAAGASAEATYVFSVPQDQRDVVTVTVGTSASTGTAVFSGPVA
jgi:hypothetical protein